MALLDLICRYADEGHDALPSQDLIKSSSTVHINLTSAGNHRQELVEAMKALTHFRRAKGREDPSGASAKTQMDLSADQVSSVDVLLTAAPKGQPDPDVLIVLGAEEDRVRSTLGFAPWRLRLTEMHAVKASVDDDGDGHVLFQDMLTVFKRFAKCERRFGR
jgi:undecaprenyl pyrophosphate synthase